MLAFLRDRGARLSDVRRTKQPRHQRTFGFQVLEPRLPMTATITNLHLVADTGRSRTDLITSQPAITGQMIGGQAEVEFDHNGDGQPEARLSVYEGTFQYNPLDFDQSLQLWEAPLVLQYKVLEYDETGQLVPGSQSGSFSMVLDRIPPRTVPLPTINVPQDAPTTIVDLNSHVWDGYSTDEYLGTRLTKTNPSLFTWAVISPDKRLILDYAPNASGSSWMTVTATDQAGNANSLSFWVHVGVNPAPVISNFQGTSGPGDMWTFSGSVTDNQPVAGLVVNFGGILEGDNLSATVQADGSFSLTTYLPGLESGTVTAIKQDIQGTFSNEASFTIFG